MDQREKYEKALVTSTDILCQNFHVDYCYPNFRALNLINQDEQEDIKSLSPRSARTLRLIEIVSNRDPVAAFDAIRSFIQNTLGQQFLIDFLDQALENQI